jgi:transcriptional regulator with XRE-family HTH domain
VDDDARGSAIKRRRETLGMKVGELAQRVGVERTTITRVEKNESTPETYAKLERALSLAEEEMGMDAPGAGQVEFVVEGHFGVRVRVKGPVADLDQMERSVERLIQKMGRPGQNLDE